MAPLTATYQVRKVCLPAQHNSRSHILLQTNNVEANSCAQLGLPMAVPRTTPWAMLYHGHVVAHMNNALFLVPANASHVAYSAAKPQEHTVPTPLGRSYHHFCLSFEEAKLPTLALHCIVSLQLLSSHTHQLSYGRVSRPFYHHPFRNSRAHLQFHCTTYYANLLRISRCLFAHPTIMKATTEDSPCLSGAMTLCSPTATVFITTHLTLDLPRSPNTQLVLSMLRMCHSSSAQG